MSAISSKSFDSLISRNLISFLISSKSKYLNFSYSTLEVFSFNTATSPPRHSSWSLHVERSGALRLVRSDDAPRRGGGN